MLNGVTMKINVDDYIINTLKEDITSEDVSTNAVMPEDKQGRADLICKQDGVICGLDVFERTFKLLDETSRFEANFKDGDYVKKGDLLGVIYGDVKAILSGERTALNYLQRMSGIATTTREYVNELEGYKTILLDTRKTTPNMRPFEKHAVKVGGAVNHRYNLSDGVLLKDNHIDFAGGIENAIDRCHKYLKDKALDLNIEIEVRDFNELQQVLDKGGVHRIMLDNFSVEDTKKAVDMIGGKYETESSGGITFDTIRKYAEQGVDFVSVGALTHSVKGLDMSFKAVD